MDEGQVEAQPRSPGERRPQQPVKFAVTPVTPPSRMVIVISVSVLVIVKSPWPEALLNLPVP